jgi:hypothetical protein
VGRAREKRGQAPGGLCWARPKTESGKEISFFSFQQFKANFQMNFEFSFVFSKSAHYTKYYAAA